MARVGERRVAFRFLVKKAEGKKLLGNPWLKLVDNIRMDVQEIA